MEIVVKHLKKNLNLAGAKGIWALANLCKGKQSFKKVSEAAALFCAIIKQNTYAEMIFEAARGLSFITEDGKKDTQKFISIEIAIILFRYLQ